MFDPFLPARILADSSQAHEVDWSPLNSADHCMDGLQQTPGICSSPPHKRCLSAEFYTHRQLQNSSSTTTNTLDFCSTGQLFSELGRVSKK